MRVGACPVPESTQLLLAVLRFEVSVGGDRDEDRGARERLVDGLVEQLVALQPSIPPAGHDAHATYALRERDLEHLGKAIDPGVAAIVDVRGAAEDVVLDG